MQTVTTVEETADIPLGVFTRHHTGTVWLQAHTDQLWIIECVLSEH